MRNPSAVIFGCSGLELTPEERSFFQEIRPFGFILFARNVGSPDQLRTLTTALRESLDNPKAPIFVDQEGGRVQRLRPPHWQSYPPMRQFGDLYNKNPTTGREVLRTHLQRMAADLLAVGINGNCLPLLDVPAPDGHNIIGDRAFAESPDVVAALGRVTVDSLLRTGVFPVIKHIPGHGRARVDSHLELPVVGASRKNLTQTDFPPFIQLADAPFAMTAHVVYEAYDPINPATLSPTVINDVIRGRMGFDGLLMSDDLSMKALRGDFTDRTRACLQAGCDLVLHCNGDMKEMQAVVKEAGPLTPTARRRWQRAQDYLSNH